MAWRLNALHTDAMTQLGMNWGLCIGSLIVVLPSVLAVKNKTEVEDEAGVSREALDQKTEQDL